MYDDNATHDGIIYTIVVRIGWQEFRSFIKVLKIKVKEYKTEHRLKVDFLESFPAYETRRNLAYKKHHRG